MGLDYTIYLAIRDKETKVNQHIIEIAYWRKGWSIRDELNSIANKPIYSLPDVYDKSDIWHTCSPAVLQAVVDLFRDNMNDIMCDLWTNSIFSAVSIRDHTIRQLANIYAAKYWISDIEDEEFVISSFMDEEEVIAKIIEFNYDYEKVKIWCEDII